jgi:uncharacterized protein YutE (UPF0331/DUF86 family)
LVDRERILAKLDELEGYLRELQSLSPKSLEDFRRIEIRRSCERLLQIAIEAVIEVCHLLVTGLRLGLPSEENDLFEKLARAGVISAELNGTLRRMRGFRNILVHEYGVLNEQIVFAAATSRFEDFSRFREEVLRALRDPSNKSGS